MAKLDMRARPRRAVLYGEVIECELGLDEPDQLWLTIRVDARHGSGDRICSR